MSALPRSMRHRTAATAKVLVALRTARRVLVLPLAAVVAATLVSCASNPGEGYAATSPYPANYRSVALPIFRNDSLMRGFERDLADALVKQVEQSTPYKVRSEAAAEARLAEAVCDAAAATRAACPIKDRRVDDMEYQLDDAQSQLGDARSRTAELSKASSI